MKAIRIATWSLVIFLILFTLADIFAGAGYLLNTILGIPFWLGMVIYGALEILTVCLLCWIEERNI